MRNADLDPAIILYFYFSHLSVSSIVFSLIELIFQPTFLFQALHLLRSYDFKETNVHNRKEIAINSMTFNEEIVFSELNTHMAYLGPENQQETANKVFN